MKKSTIYDWNKKKEIENIYRTQKFDGHGGFFYLIKKKILGKGLKEIVTSYKMRQKISHSYQKWK